VPNCACLRISTAEAITVPNFTQEDKSNTIFKTYTDMVLCMHGLMIHNMVSKNMIPRKQPVPDIHSFVMFI
jgi:hypothetical protein